MRSPPASLIAALRLLALLLLVAEPLRWGWDQLMASEIRLSLHDAGRRRSVEGGLGQEIAVVGGEGRVGIFAHPRSRLEWPLVLRRGEHRFLAEVALSEEAWDKSDGVSFAVKIVQEGLETTILDRSLEPAARGDDRGWIAIDASFQSEGGPVVIALETGQGGAAHSDFDWAWWAEPRIEEGWRPLSVGWLAAFALASWLLSRELGARMVSGRLVGPPILVILTLVVMEILFRSAPEAFPPAAHKYLARDGFCEVGDRNPQRLPDDELGFREPGGRCDTYKVEADAIVEKDLSPAFERRIESSVRVCMDKDGFRNPLEMNSIDIVVTGDSFVQGAWVDYPEVWTTQLGEKLGKSVLNLGVSGYAPRQSLITLLRHGLPRQPALVLFALFEGNDLPDEEQFEAFQRSGMSWSRFILATREVRESSILVRRHEHSFALAGISYLLDVMMDGLGRRVSHVEENVVVGFNPLCTTPDDDAPFCIAVTARELYQETLSEEQWRSRPGAQSLRRVLQELGTATREAGVDLEIVLIPSRTSILLPYLIDDLDEVALAEFMETVSSEVVPEGGWTSRLERNTGSVHQVFLDQVAEAGLEIIDLRPAFVEAVQRGETLFFPYDSHWNTIGNRLAAATIAERLTE